MEEEAVRGMIELWAKETGSQRALAKTMGVSEGYLSDVLRGDRKPGRAILEFLGLRAVTTYEFVHEGDDGR